MAITLKPDTYRPSVMRHDPEQAAQHCIEWIQTTVASFAELISLLPSQQAELAGRVPGEPT